MTCKACAHWRQISDTVAGQCHMGKGITSVKYSCEKYKPRWAKAERKAAKPFDVEAAANRLMARKPATVSIQSVHDALRCTYEQAAEVVQLLLERGDIG